MNNKKHVVIVGGGFGGIKSALELEKLNNTEITLISDKDSFWYYPSFYRTATGAPTKLSIIPLKELFKDKSINIIINPAIKIDLENKELTLKNKTKIAFDYCILSLGVITNYFGIDGLEQYSYGVKTIADVTALKKHLHSQLVKDQKPDLNYIVVGGGPTGIELAGELSGYLNHIMNKHSLKKNKLHIELVESAPKLLPRLDSSAGKKVAKHLRSLGVEIILGESVKGETAEDLTVGNKKLLSRTVIWTAGQSNNPFYSNNNIDLADNKKVKINEYLECSKDIYVIGDNANTPYSGLAQTAIYDAEFVADNINRKITGNLLNIYTPKKPIYVIPAGGKWAYVEWGNYKFYGFIGWLLRHAGNLKGFMEIENIIDASEQWIQEFETEYHCKICES